MRRTAFLLFATLCSSLHAEEPTPAIEASTIEDTADAYLAAIQAQDWQRMTTFLGPASHYEDYTMEHFDRPRIDLRGAEAIVDFWRTSSEDSGAESIHFDLDERFVAGSNLFLLGHSEVRVKGAAWELPVEILETRFPQITHLRVEKGKVAYHADHVDYRTAEQQIAAQVEAWREEHGGEASFPVTEVDPALKGRAEDYLAALREKRWDVAATYLDVDTRYQNFAAEQGGNPVDLEGAKALLGHYRTAAEELAAVETDFEVEEHFVAGSNVFLVGQAYVKRSAAAWGLVEGDFVDARFRQIHHLRFADGKVTHHIDHGDHVAAAAEYEEVVRRKREAQAEMARYNEINHEIYAEVRPFQEAGNLLGEVEALRGMVEQYADEGPLAQGAVGQNLATKESFLGNHRTAHRLFYHGRAMPAAQEADPSLLEGFEPRSAVSMLVAAATAQRAVFINEAHHVAQHRVLTLQLLPLLRDLGFTHFAAETLNEVDKDLAKRGYPNGATGYYTQEPLYGDLVRVALALGYEVVAYEPVPEPGHGPAQREPGQARNLKERIFDKNPEARVVVHLGYSHNSESPRSFRGVGSMTVHFKAMTGIDPLTVDQTTLTGRHDPAWESALYRWVVDTWDLTEATVFMNAAGDFWSAPETHRDVTVLVPRSRMENGRATWWSLGGMRQAVPLPEDVCGAAAHCLVEARPVEEGGDAIPVDRVEIRQGEGIPVLMLPAGEFEVRAVNAAGEEVHSSERVVPASPPSAPSCSALRRTR